MTPSTCGHKSHRAYTEAVEGARIQVHLISREANRYETEMQGGGTPRFDILDVIVDRVRFAKENYDDAERAVNKHMSSGRCLALEGVLA